MKLKELRDFTSSENNFTKIPEIVFECSKLESLSIDRCYNEMVVSDNISKLTNLKKFMFYNASFTYISPQLFLLPKIEQFNFALSKFKEPYKDIYNAIKSFKTRQHQNTSQTFGMGDDWFKEIWDQV